MVRVELPSGVPDVVDTVRTELIPGVIEAGLNDAVAPVGRPAALRLIVPVKPLSALALTV